MDLYFNLSDNEDVLLKCKLDIPAIKKLLKFDSSYFENNEKLIVYLNSRKYQVNLIKLEAEHLFNETRKCWRILESVLSSNSTLTLEKAIKYRKEILLMLCSCMFNLKSDYEANNILILKLKLLENGIFNISDLKEDTLAKISITSMQNSKTQVYHYFHCYLDIRWILLITKQLCGTTQGETENTFAELMKDLVTISKNVYLCVNPQNALEITPFVCPCLKEMWLRLQFFAEDICNSKLFWICFNNILKHENYFFSLWMLYHTSFLYRYDDCGNDIGKSNSRIQENHSFIENVLKTMLQTVESNNDLLSSLKLIKPLLNEWWIKTAKLDPYQVLWDYFYKNLNTINDKIPSTVDEIVENCTKHNSNPYNFYVHMLMNHLRNHPHHWSKLKGRIYSRFSPHKVNELNDSGLYNVVVLFLSLVNINHEESIDKLYMFFKSLSEDRQNTDFVWNIYIVLIITCIKKNINSDTVLDLFSKLLDEAAMDRNQFHLIRNFVNGFEHIILISTNFKLNQKKLLGGWINNYLLHCSYSDLCFTLNIFICLMEKLQTFDTWTEWEHEIQAFLFPVLRQVAEMINAPSQIGKLAATITQNNKKIRNEAIAYFTSESVSPKVTAAYMCCMLQNYPTNCTLTENQTNSMMQAWARCSMLTIESQEHINLTKIMLKLNTINLPPLWYNEDPLCDFIKQMCKQSNSPQLRNIFNVCFENVDSWILPYILNPTNITVTLRIYTCCACLVYFCAQFLYHKIRSSCILSRLIMVLLLPGEFLKGREHHPYIHSAIQQTLHLFIKGICKLNRESDIYLERTLKDLIVRYLPYFYEENSPLLKSLDDASVADVICEKIAFSFIAHPLKSSEENSNKALNIIYIYLQSCTSLPSIQCVVQKTITGLMEFMIFQSNRQRAVEILRFLAASEFYISVRDVIRKGIQTMTKKYMAFNTNNYFPFILLLIKLIPLDVQAVLPDIKQQIRTVEQMRGVGFDNVLRQGLSKIEKALICE